MCGMLLKNGNESKKDENINVKRNTIPVSR